MAAAPTSVGDVVILAAGSDVPLIVRPCGEYYTYVCAAHFPGAMYGEMWPDDMAKLQDITFI
jgi:hypothetical protein